MTIGFRDKSGAWATINLPDEDAAESMWFSLEGFGIVVYYWSSRQGRWLPAGKNKGR